MWICKVRLELCFEESTPLVAEVVLLPVQMLQGGLEHLCQVVPGQLVLASLLNNGLNQPLEVILQSFKGVIVALVVPRVQVIRVSDAGLSAFEDVLSGLAVCLVSTTTVALFRRVSLWYLNCLFFILSIV